MQSERKSNAAPILAALAILAAFVAAYAGGYFWLGEERIWLTEVEMLSGQPGVPGNLVVQSSRERAYPQLWLEVIYRPAGRLETWLSGNDVAISCDGPAD